MSENTDNLPQISLDDIKKVAASNKDLESALVQYGLQTETGKTLLNNHLKAHSGDNSTAINEATKKAYGNVDSILQKYGYEKPSDAKTTDNLDTILGGFMSKIEKLEKQVKAGGDSQSIMDQMKADFTKEIEDYKSQLQNKDKEIQGNKILGDINNVSLTYDPTLPEIAVKSTVANVDKMLMANAKIIEGKVVYHKDDGSVWLNEQYVPASAQEIKSQLLKDILKKKGKGGAADKDGTSTTSMKGGSLDLGNVAITSRVGLVKAFNQACNKQGIAEGSDEKIKQWEAVKKNYGYDSLPTK